MHASTSSRMAALSTTQTSQPGENTTESSLKRRRYNESQMQHQHQLLHLRQHQSKMPRTTPSPMNFVPLPQQQQHPMFNFQQLHNSSGPSFCPPMIVPLPGYPPLQHQHPSQLMPLYPPPPPLQNSNNFSVRRLINGIGETFAPGLQMTAQPMFSTHPQFQFLGQFFPRPMVSPIHQVQNATESRASVPSGRSTPVESAAMRSPGNECRSEPASKSGSTGDVSETPKLPCAEAKSRSLSVTSSPASAAHSIAGYGEKPKQQSVPDRLIKTISRLTANKVHRGMRKVCNQCSETKSRCIRNGPNEPCLKCAKTGKECVFAEQRKRGRAYKYNFASSPITNKISPSSLPAECKQSMSLEEANNDTGSDSCGNSNAD